MPVRPYRRSRYRTESCTSKLTLNGSAESSDEIAIVLAAFPEVSEGAKPGLLVCPKRARVGDGSGQAYELDAFGSKLGEQMAKGSGPNSLPAGIGLADQDVHVDQVTWQVIETARGQLCWSGRPPAEEANGSCVEVDQRRGVRRVLPDSGESLFGVTPPYGNVGPK